VGGCGATVAQTLKLRLRGECLEEWFIGYCSVHMVQGYAVYACAKMTVICVFQALCIQCKSGIRNDNSALLARIECDASVRSNRQVYPYDFFPLSLHLSKASSAVSIPISHLSAITPQLLRRIIFSTALSFRINIARLSVLASRGKYLALYGSSRSSTTRSLALLSSTCLKMFSGSSGSGLHATAPQ
jgi:hypothetical protein